MDAELKYKLNHAPAAKYGGVYEFTNANGSYTGLCIVVSAPHREWDKYISAITLSSCDYDDGMHNDEIGISLPDGRSFWVHCGMVTYIRRDRLGELIYKVSKQTMNLISEGIKQELGLSPKTDRIIVDNEPDYKKMYHDLIKTIASWNTMDSAPAKKRAIKKGENY